MSEFKWIQTSLFLFALLQFPAAETEITPPTARAGGQVTLSCENVIKDQDNCRSTTWLFSGSGVNAAETLFEDGKINGDSEAKKDRLNVTADCSLVIKKVTEEDAGSYTCRHFSESGEKIGEDTRVYLSVTRREDTRPTTKPPTTTTTRPTTRPTTTTTTTTTTTRSTTRPTTTTTTRPTTKPTTTTKIQTTVTNTTAPLNSDSSKGWLYVLVAAVVLVALLIIVGKVIRWKRTKGNETPGNDSVGLTSDPSGTRSAAETSQDTADRVDGVAYASIRFTKAGNSKARVGKPGRHAEDEAVTYATMKAAPTSSAAAGPSVDPSSLYATINKTNK
uniref:uncharacterized protein isoform X2 n=1 Tax=Semicossyphus pulcher TaxID=241346 RepID=UPI0037E72052